MTTENFRQSELAEFFKEERLAIVSFRSIYLIKETVNTIDGVPFYGIYKVYSHKGDLPLTKKGRFFAMTTKEANRLVPIFS